MRAIFRSVLGVAAGFILLVTAGCSGGGETTTGGTTPGAPKTLTWNPPTTFADGTPLDPATALNAFEIYVRVSGPFSDADTPAAFVRAVDPVSGEVTTTYNLGNLNPYLTHGVVYQIALRAVALDGAKSDFSQPAGYSF